MHIHTREQYSRPGYDGVKMKCYYKILLLFIINRLQIIFDLFVLNTQCAICDRIRRVVYVMPLFDFSSVLCLCTITDTTQRAPNTCLQKQVRLWFTLLPVDGGTLCLVPLLRKRKKIRSSLYVTVFRYLHETRASSQNHLSGESCQNPINHNFQFIICKRYWSMTSSFVNVKRLCKYNKME